MATALGLVLWPGPAAAQPRGAPASPAAQQARIALGTYFDPLNFATGDGRWHATAYAGPLARNKLSRVVRFDADLTSRWLGGLGVGHEFAAYADVLRFEWEANVAVHDSDFGTVADLRAMVGARWTWFPWNHLLPTTFAVMTGPSYLTGDSSFEVRKGKTSRFANGMAFELTFALPQHEDIRGVFRIHHRSPVFGVTGTASPSDAVTFGLQRRF